MCSSDLPVVDVWLGETLSTLDEARLVREITLGDQKPLWLSYTLQDDAPGPPQLRSGERVEVAAELVKALGAEAILFNCSQPEVMENAIRAARQTLGAAKIRIGAYANAFAPMAKDAEANDGLDEIRQDLTPSGYAQFARVWQDQGASIIGGCCGISPEHIAALNANLKEKVQ